MKYRIVKVKKYNGNVFYKAEFLDRFFFIKFWNDIINHDDYHERRIGWPNKKEFDSQEEADEAIKLLQNSINADNIISEEVVKVY